MDKVSIISILSEEKEKVCKETKKASEKLSISNPCILCFMGSKEGICTFSAVANYFKNK